MTRSGPSEALAALAERLWIRPAEGHVHVSWDNAPAPVGHVLLEEYAVVPSVRAPRFLVPLDDRLTAVRCVLGYNRLRPRSTQLLRIGVAVAVLLRSEQVGLMGRMRVWATPETGRRQTCSPLLSDALRAVLASPDSAFCVGVHELDPNFKPTLQIFDRHGVRGFAKVGWTAPTAGLVVNEAEALAASNPSRQSIRRPGLLHRGSWCNLPITVVEPMPTSVRRYRSASPPPPPALADVAGALTLRRLATTDYWRGIQEFLAVQCPPDLRAGLIAYALAVEKAARDPLAFGRWHGDWVPWNLAVDGHDLHVFDWEHSADTAPWGFDLAHWSFQKALVTDGLDARGAAAATDRETLTWPSSGVNVPQPGVVVSLYLLEMALRTIRLRIEGGTWNPHLHPDLFDVLTERLSRGLSAN